MILLCVTRVFKLSRLKKTRLEVKTHSPTLAGLSWEGCAEVVGPGTGEEGGVATRGLVWGTQKHSIEIVIHSLQS